MLKEFKVGGEMATKCVLGGEATTDANCQSAAVAAISALGLCQLNFASAEALGASGSHICSEKAERIRPEYTFMVI